MVSASRQANFSLNVMINRDKDKVLFAEADSDFVDILLSFLTLPLGKIPGLLQKQYGFLPIIGSLTTLYTGISNLNNVHFLSEDGKKSLLNPRNSFEAECRKLKLNLDYDINTSTNTGEGSSKRKRVKTEADDVDVDGDATDVGVFTEKAMSFLITDDLRVAPIVHGSIVKSLSRLGITDVGGAEMKVVTLGLTEIMGLLRESLRSETPLTHIVIGKEYDDVYSDYERTYERLICLRRDLIHQMAKEATLDCKKMTVNAILQKANNRVLFVLVEKDFVDYLFSFLTVPLGGVKCLWGNNTSTLVAIDNLYNSLKNLKNDKHPKLRERINRLIKPELPLKLVPKNPTISTAQPPQNNASYIKGSVRFRVTDDLTVTPLSVTSSISVLNKMKIPLSDVKEVEMRVGVEEVLSILRASLLSTSALTDGLVNPILKKKPN